MNKSTILGNMCRDLEKKTSKNGTTFYTLSVADNQGKEKDQVIFWDVIFFGELRIAEWLKKGSAIVVTGQVNPVRTYEKKDGSTGVSMSFTAASIDFSPFKSAEKKEDAPAQQAAPQDNMPF